MTSVIGPSASAENTAGSLSDARLNPVTPSTEERQFLLQLWLAVEQLPLLQRAVYLLSGTTHAHELFWLHGITSMRKIGRTLQLTPEQFQRAWVLLDWRTEPREQAQRLTNYDEQFALLWQQLPLTDLTLAALFATSQSNINKLRHAALHRLRHQLEPSPTREAAHS